MSTDLTADQVLSWVSRWMENLSATLHRMQQSRIGQGPSTSQKIAREPLSASQDQPARSESDVSTQGD